MSIKRILLKEIISDREYIHLPDEFGTWVEPKNSDIKKYLWESDYISKVYKKENIKVTASMNFIFGKLLHLTVGRGLKFIGEDLKDEIEVPQLYNYFFEADLIEKTYKKLSKEVLKWLWNTGARS